MGIGIGINLALRRLGAAAVAWQNSGTWSAAVLPFTNTPTLGVEKLADGGLEGAYTAGRSGQFTATTGSPTLTQSSDVHGGSSAQQLIGTANGDFIAMLVPEVAGTWYQVTVWAKRTAGSAGGGVISLSDGANALNVVTITGASYAQFIRIFRSQTTANNYIRFNGGGPALFDTLLSDDYSVKALTLNTLFNVRAGASLPTSVSATGTIVANTIAGVVYGLDSISAPTNLIQATHDGGTSIKLEKMVAGVWSVVLTTTATYVGGVLPEIRWISANTFGLFYNGTQRGANQTISDAGTGNLHGVISTSPLNTITGCTVS